MFKGVSHRNILKLIDSCPDNDFVYLIFEYEEKFQELSTVLQNTHFDEYVVKMFAKQLLAVIEYLHSIGLTHRELVPESFLYNSTTGVLRLYSLRNATRKNPITDTQGASGYSAPEVFFEPEYNSSCDLWNLGMIVYTLLTGKYAFKGEKEADVLLLVKDLKFDTKSTEWGNLSKNAQTFVERLLTDAKQRATVAQCSSHPFLYGVV